MTRKELAYWTAPGEKTQRGTVVHRGKSTSAAITVDWEDGRREKVRPTDPAVVFAFEGSTRQTWILNPHLLEKRLKEDSTSVVIDVIKDQGAPISGAAIKKQLTSLGISTTKVDNAFETAKPSLKKNLHIVISRGVTFSWSDVEVDPYAHLRSKAPSDALDHLLSTPRLMPEEKLALADAIRAGFRK